MEYDPDMEAMLLVLRGEIPCKIHCTQYDMLTAIEVAKALGYVFLWNMHGAPQIIWMRL